MSSGAFSSELRPDWRRRAAVLAGGALAGLAGLVLIAGLPAAAPTRGFLGVLWLVASGSETAVIAAAYMRCRGLRLHADGELSVLRRDGRWQRARLLPDSIVLLRQAWLRVRLADGLEFPEWVAGDSRESQQWRRFQVIFRHL